MKRSKYVYEKSLDMLVLIVVFTLFQASPAGARDVFKGNQQRAVNPEAVAKAKAGELTEVNATWWGFDPEDSTRFLQAAIDSGAKKVIVSNMGADWVIQPIMLADNQEIFFEPGVVITAKRGAFHGLHDSLFKALDKSGIKLTGYGATFRMQKADYMSDNYQKGEWRSGIFLDGCSGVEIRGMTIRDTGGDGIYFGNWGRGYSDDIVIEDVIFDNNYRQGISVISAEDMLIENCVFKNTGGTGPAAGIDLEPDGEDNRLVNIVVRNCVAENNEGPGYVVSPAKMSSKSKDISILFENCYVKSGQSHGLMVSAIRDDGPGGYVEFRNCHVEQTRLHGARILDKSSTSAVVRFVNCTWKNVATGGSGSESTWNIDHANKYEGVPNVPIVIHLRGAAYSNRPGGVVFTDCVLIDDVARRPFISYRAPFDNAPGLFDVQGNLSVISPHGVSVDLGMKVTDVALRLNR